MLPQELNWLIDGVFCHRRPSLDAALPLVYPAVMVLWDRLQLEPGGGIIFHVMECSCAYQEQKSILKWINKIKINQASCESQGQGLISHIPLAQRWIKAEEFCFFMIC